MTAEKSSKRPQTHEHTYTFVTVKSCLLDGSREEIAYVTRQCTTCYHLPTTDFRKYRMRPEDCLTCAALIQVGMEILDKLPEKGKQLEARIALKLYRDTFIRHTKLAHPERLIPDEPYSN